MLNIHCFHVQPPDNWDGGVGFMSKEMIQAHCPAPATDIQVKSLVLTVQVLKSTSRNLEAIIFAQWKRANTVRFLLPGVEMRASPHEQSHGCAPGRAWLHEGDAVPVLIKPRLCRRIPKIIQRRDMFSLPVELSHVAPTDVVHKAMHRISR